MIELMMDDVPFPEPSQEGRDVSVWVEIRRFLFLRRYLVRQLIDGRPVTVGASFSARVAARHCAQLQARLQLA